MTVISFSIFSSPRQIIHLSYILFTDTLVSTLRYV